MQLQVYVVSVSQAAEIGGAAVFEGEEYVLGFHLHRDTTGHFQVCNWISKEMSRL